MKKWSSAGFILTLSAIFCSAQTPAGQNPGTGAKAVPQQQSGLHAPSQKEAINKYCVTCHNSRIKTGGLALDKLDLTHVATDAQTWEKVIRKVRAGVMPPPGMPRPDTPHLEL